MKKRIALLLAALMLTGCAANTTTETTANPETAPAETAAAVETTPVETIPAPEYVSRFDTVTEITLSDDGITVDGGEETDTVFTSNDIIYYEDKDFYSSGNPYGEGEAHERHSTDAAAAHTVVNITAPGAYRVSGKLSAGQIRVDLGDDAYDDPNAVVELILDNADITCTVAPTILFLNTYECDGEWDVTTAQPTVDTTAAGANLILEGTSTVSGSYVAKIFKDADGEKKLWKQDGAIYSYMSMNVFGPGALTLNAANEGLDTELHLTINGGDIAIRSGNDGINTNEDGVSVTTINGGTLHIIAGLGEEGDGIDSNGYLVINGGTVVSSANPAGDAGLDSDMGSYVNGGTVIALGSTMDWAESDSDQVTMNLQFADYQSNGSAIVVTREDGTVIFAYDPTEDEVLGKDTRRYQGAILSSPSFVQGETYYVFLDGTVTGTETGGVYETVTAYDGGIQQMYTGTDVTMGGRGMGNRGGMGAKGEMPEGMEIPEDDRKGFAGGEMPEDFTLPEGETMPEGGFGGGRGGEKPEDFDGEMPQGMSGERPALPDGETMPADFDPSTMGDRGSMRQTGEKNGSSNTVFYMQDKVNCFSGVTAVTE